jgi:SAM-dependent methyltransferase
LSAAIAVINVESSMNLTIRYDHADSPPAGDGPYAALSKIFVDNRPDSLLDVGCGTGTWLKAADQLGVLDVHGIDGIDACPSEYSRTRFSKRDLTRPFRLGRRYDVVLCLEVAEHLEEAYANVLIQSLVAHAPKVIFSAACPGQSGQHHVNCQWPDYWQSLFNKEGFACDDAIRWSIWGDPRIRPWYRQNMFAAMHAPALAGREPRIVPVVHPDMLRAMTESSSRVPQRLLRGIRWVRSIRESIGLA